MSELEPVTETLADDYDAFEEFNKAMGSGAVRDPYPSFAELRKQGPIVKIDLSGMTGGSTMMKNMPKEIFVAVTHEAVSHVLRDAATFSSSGYEQIMGIVMGHSILEMDEPEHSRYRGLIQQAFTRKIQARWETELVHPIVHKLIDDFADRGRADLVRELTFPFPVNVIAGMLGLPHEDLPQFHRWAVELISVGHDWERGLAASKKLAEYFGGILAERREQPREDLISLLAQVELDGHRLTDDDIFAFLRLLLPAGAETTYRSSSNLLFGLLSHPEQLDAVRKDRSLIPQAIEEGLRWEAPLTGISRKASKDVEIFGVKIPKDATVAVNMGSANHDETRYENPEAFDIFRPPQQHMAFAFGPHRCLGMHLARMETTVALNAVFDRLPGVRLDPDAEDVHITGQAFRAPSALPVVFGS
ncbi:MAG: cytochrome P450 [Deltaproteobacteria bacterium]|nr:MAG: cytochrome P450 [Deltaproteobacteria bacterium]